MKLTVDFSALKRAVAPLGAVVTDFAITRGSTELESIASHLNQGLILGEDIQLDEIDGSDGILNYDGHQVMLYIPDQGDDIAHVLSDGKQGRRIHVAECSTLEFMRETGRFKRYDVINRVDGLFPVFGYEYRSRQSLEGEADLGVCKNCLKILNYHGYASQGGAVKAKVFNDFSFEKFFEVYSSYFKSLPTTNHKAISHYTADWPAISAKVRSELDYTCEQCGVDLNGEKQLLHTHHVNGNKSDNERSNLRVLCADCHKKQPHHDHIFVSNSDVLKINQLRREQHKFDVSSYDNILNYADTALFGLLTKCQTTRLPLGDLGIVINDNENFVSIDLCWPRRKVAVLINADNTAILQKHGWTVFTAFEALSNFESFQNKIR